MTAAFDAFVARFHDHFTQDPNACIGLGIEARQGELPDPSLDATRIQVARARRLLDRLDGIDRSPLDFDQCLDLEMARLWLERSIFNDTLPFNGRTTSEQRPTTLDSPY